MPSSNLGSVTFTTFNKLKPGKLQQVSRNEALLTKRIILKEFVFLRKLCGRFECCLLVFHTSQEKHE